MRSSATRQNCLTLIEKTKGYPFIIFDTETTGLSHVNDRIVELSAQKYISKDGNVKLIDQIDIYIRPPFFMSDKVVNVHHITNEYLADKPDEMVIFPVIRDFFGERPILLAYNIKFDIKMLEALYQRHGAALHYQVLIDVLEMARDIFPKGEVPDHKLGTLVEMLGLDVGLTFHNALDDTTATYRLLMYCYEEYRKMKQNSNLRKLYVNSLWFWKGFNKHQTGIYVNSSEGKVYFSTFAKEWKSSEVVLEEVDIDDLQNEVLLRLGLTYDEFSHLTEKKFKELRKR